MKISTQAHGLDRLETAFAALAEDGAMDDAVDIAAQDMLAAASTALNDGAPPDSRTGNLAASLEIAQGAGRFERLVGTPLAYGRVLEFGTVSRPAAPWLGPSFLDVLSNLRSRIAEAV